MKKKQDTEWDLSLEKILDLLQTNEPKLKESSEIPDNVMQKIQQEQLKKSSTKDHSSPTVVRYLTLVQRMLAAASVCLLILYGAEEFTIVSKLNRLEHQTAAFNADPAGSHYQHQILNRRSFAFLWQRHPDHVKFYVAEHLHPSQKKMLLSPLNPIQ